ILVAPTTHEGKSHPFSSTSKTASAVQRNLRTFLAIASLSIPSRLRLAFTLGRRRRWAQRVDRATADLHLKSSPSDVRVPASSSAVRAACQPAIPFTPGPGGVDADAR